MKVFRLALYATAAYFLFCFWNYALTTELFRIESYGVFDSPWLFGFSIVTEKGNDGYLKGLASSIDLLLSAAIVFLASFKADQKSWYEPYWGGFKKALKVTVIYSSLMVASWEVVLLGLQPEWWDSTLTDSMVFISNSEALLLSILLLCFILCGPTIKRQWGIHFGTEE